MKKLQYPWGFDWKSGDDVYNILSQVILDILDNTPHLSEKTATLGGNDRGVFLLLVCHTLAHEMTDRVHDLVTLMDQSKRLN